MMIRVMLLIIAITGLLCILCFSLLYAGGHIDFTNYKLSLIISSVAWFGGVILRSRFRIH
jgi:hypothetical protein